MESAHENCLSQYDDDNNDDDGAILRIWLKSFVDI